MSHMPTSSPMITTMLGFRVTGGALAITAPLFHCAPVSLDPPARYALSAKNEPFDRPYRVG
jgi:hypothetical protein